MFKNHGFQVKMINTKKQDALDAVENSFDLEKIAQIIKENAKPVLITIAAAVVAKKVLDTTCEIAVIAADAHFNK